MTDEDPQTRGERAAWWVQRQFRRWSVLVVINAIAILWLAFGNADLRNWWNFVWSALAVDVEFITALALVSMSYRDHQRLIRIERMENDIKALLDHLGVDRSE